MFGVESPSFELKPNMGGGGGGSPPLKMFDLKSPSSYLKPNIYSCSPHSGTPLGLDLGQGGIWVSLGEPLLAQTKGAIGVLEHS